MLNPDQRHNASRPTSLVGAAKFLNLKYEGSFVPFYPQQITLTPV